MADRDRADWERIKELVADALELEPQARATALARLEQETPKVAERVRALVAAAGKSELDGLSDPTPLIERELSARDWIGAEIGGYRVARFLARGGMGEVYEAVQAGTGRRVALKLLARASRREHSRFQLEGRLLGRLDHPNIAGVLDADVHRASDGTRWPYLALELVDGEPLTSFARRRGLGRQALLELFVEVCQGVEHAHRKGIVHRDLKPDNILVAVPDGDTAGRGQPKILDFGIAGLTDDQQQLEASTRLTRTGDLIGTLAYMAPEQVDPGAHPVDARTDVHGLGVILFELLTGRLPFELTGRPLTASLALIREAPAPRPSIHDRSLRGDLDTIVTTALAKEPVRRYPSAAALAADIERHLAHEPLEARPASAWYRARKFVQRHRTLVGVTGLAALLLSLGTLGTAIGLARARAEVRHTREVNAFFGEVLGAPSPFNLGRDVSYREVLDTFAPQIDQRFAAHPRTAAELHRSVGWAYYQLGLKQPSLEHLSLAESASRAAFGADRLESLEALRELHEVRLGLDEDWGTALDETRALAARMTAQVGAQHGSSLLAERNVASALEQGGDYEASVVLQRALLERARPAFESGQLDTETFETILNGLGTTLAWAGDSRAALELYSEIDQLRSSRLGELHPATLSNLANAAAALSELGDERAALRLAEPLRQKMLEVFGSDHPAYLNVSMAVGNALVGLGRPEEGIEVLESVAETRERVLGPLHVETLLALNNLAVACGYAKRLDRKEQVVDLLIERTAGREADNGIGLSALSLRADLLAEQGRLEEAHNAMLAVVEGYGRIFGAGHPNTLIQRNNLARLLHAKLGRPAEAVPILADVVAAWRTAVPGDPSQVRALMWNLGRAQADAGQFEAAERTLREVEALADRDPANTVDPEALQARLLSLREEWVLARKATSDAE